MKKKNCKKLIVLVIAVIAVLALLVINNKEYYRAPSRVDKLKKTIATEAKNSELSYKTVGWLQIQGTNIDYQIIHNKEDGGTYPVQMETYLWTENNLNKKSNNIIVNGHNIFNLSTKPEKKSKLFTRAEELMSFVYYDFAKENKYMQLTIDDKAYVYKIFAVSFLSDSDSTFVPKSDNLPENTVKNYIKLMKLRSIYDYKVDVNEKDKIITVTTCTRMFSDPSMQIIYVSGRLLRVNEKNKNYGLEKSERYEIIEEIWEDSDDEEV